MRPFSYTRATEAGAALQPDTKYVAGGTNLIDLMKCDVERPAHLVDVNGLASTSIERVSGGVRIGAMARMSDVASHALIIENFPAVSQALLLSASAQIRNAASIGGNLMQRTRCPYFRELTFTPCNKRNPGSGCSAIGGENRLHAVLGTSDACIATHPSDLAVALAAFDAVIEIRPAGEDTRAPFRSVAATAFHLLPGSTPHIEHDLKPGELITSIFVPEAAHARRSAYLKVRDRASYEFAVTSAAVGLDATGGLIRSARIALGGVGTKPWRSHEAEAGLAGKPASEATFRAAAEEAMRSAKSYGQNGFKIELAKRTIVRALGELA